MSDAATRRNLIRSAQGVLFAIIGLCLCAIAGAQDFPLARGSYLSTEPVQAVGVAIASDGSIIVGLNRNVGDGNPDNDFGVIERRRPDTTELIEQWPLASPLRSLRQSDHAGPAWIAIGSSEVLLGSASGAQLADQWALIGLVTLPKTAVTCGGGRLAVLFGNQVAVYSEAGALLHQFSITATSVDDLACSTDPLRVYLTGYRQASANLQVAYVEAFDSSGTRQWRSWGWSSSEAQAVNLNSDTRGRVLRLVGDALYFAGSSAGGVPVYQRDPQNLALGANNVSFDLYNQTSNLGGPSISYYANLDPANGSLRRGQFLLTRLSAGGGNSVSVLSMSLDSLGRLHLGGRAFASMANRSSLQVAGLPVGPYSGGDPHLLVIPAAFTSRVHWTTFVDTDGRGSVVAIASRDGREAFLIDSNQGSLLTPGGLITAKDLNFIPGSSQPAAWMGLWGDTSFESDIIFADGFD